MVPRMYDYIKRSSELLLQLRIIFFSLRVQVDSKSLIIIIQKSWKFFRLKKYKNGKYIVTQFSVTKRKV